MVTIRDCYDGDTCCTGSGERIRLAFINSDELRGRCANPVPAKAACDHPYNMVAVRRVGIRRITKDRYRRTVAELFIDGSNGQQWMVASGHAQIYWKYSSPCNWTR